MRKLALWARLSTSMPVGCGMAACDSEDGGLLPSSYALPKGRSSHAEALAEVEQRLRSASERAEARPESWMAQEAIASAWMDRARLSGELEDYARARQALARAFALADDSGPFLLQATLDFTLHRFFAVESSLQALEGRLLLDDATRSALLGVRGDLLLQQGEMDEAKATLTAAEALRASSSSAAKLAHLAWRTGDLAMAGLWYAEVLSRYHGSAAFPRAWVQLQLGLIALEYGRYDSALDHYLAANEELSGYWLIEEHVAEVLALLGRHAEALGLYLSLIERRENPEFMDAAARLYFAAGDDQAGQQWVARARAIYEDQLLRFPEASYGHALQHYLYFGPAETAVALAQKNFALRPNGEAARLLAEAQFIAGRKQQAVASIEIALDSGWVSPLQHDSAARIYAALGEPELARVHREIACQQNPQLCGEN